MLFGARNRLELVVYLRNHGALYLIFSLGANNRVPQIERNAIAGNLGGVHAVAADTRRSVNQRHDLAACLQQLIRDNQSDVAGTNHENFLTWLHAVQVHHGLRRTGADDARLRPTVKQNHISAAPVATMMLSPEYCSM